MQNIEVLLHCTCARTERKLHRSRETRQRRPSKKRRHNHSSRRLQPHKKLTLKKSRLGG